MESLNGPHKVTAATKRKPLTEDAQGHHNGNTIGFLKERVGQRKGTFLSAQHLLSVILSIPPKSLGDKCFHSCVPEVKTEIGGFKLNATASLSTKPRSSSCLCCPRACPLSEQSQIQETTKAQDRHHTPESEPSHLCPTQGSRRPGTQSLRREVAGKGLTLWSHKLACSPPREAEDPVPALPSCPAKLSAPIRPRPLTYKTQALPQAGFRFLQHSKSVCFYFSICKHLSI